MRVEGGEAGVECVAYWGAFEEIVLHQISPELGSSRLVRMTNKLEETARQWRRQAVHARMATFRSRSGVRGKCAVRVRTQLMAEGCSHRLHGQAYFHVRRANGPRNERMPYAFDD